MNNHDLLHIEARHLLWLENDLNGEQADLRGADLCGADLHGADLCGANLHGANLCGADLCGANLHGANLCEADLYGADLRGANLREANLREADLHRASLCAANLCEANLHRANLRGVNLCGANLCEANLRGADLHEANLCGAKTDNYTVFNMVAWPLSCNSFGVKATRRLFAQLLKHVDQLDVSNADDDVKAAVTAIKELKDKSGERIVDWFCAFHNDIPSSEDNCV